MNNLFRVPCRNFLKLTLTLFYGYAFKASFLIILPRYDLNLVDRVPNVEIRRCSMMHDVGNLTYRVDLKWSWAGHIGDVVMTGGVR